jgi:hypothetical protein
VSIVSEVPLKLVGTDEEWIDAISLQTQLILRSRPFTRSLGEIFEPCRSWIELLISESRMLEGTRFLAGSHIDSIFPNAYVVSGECRIADREWIWQGMIRMNVVVIRAIYDFLSKIETTPFFARALSARSGKRLIFDIANSLGVELVEQDFIDFISLESDIQWIVFDVDKSKQSVYLRWFFVDRPTLQLFRKIKCRMRGFLSRIRTRISTFT